MMLSRIRTYGRMIKFSHTVFALPFALSAAVLVHQERPLTPATVFWILVAMVSARSAAMGFNRIADADLDARNPRTANREIPLGVISRRWAGAFVAVSAALFVGAAAMLSRLCFVLSIPVLAVLFAYSYTKRFTWLSHIVLGFAIGMAPTAVWVAASGTITFRICVMSVALLTYIAGFDILYACQDVDFDRREGLHSIPQRFGIQGALKISRLLHAVSVACLAGMYELFSLHVVYLFFVAAIAVLFVVEHLLVRKDDLSRIDIAFFNVNSAISVLVLAAIVAGETAKRWT
ncbi:MAG TPA: UbiA-like polyprenyltransferase [Deltaproteobacteria bacterium]|nr:UbiA-like polyprenyltransferase [Deltaproteobacteria bacterium]HOM28459.1 UbiA-like polyprenyltransferase [Deltaproteobacteria bacterium]HPP79664.1 UbiA-like polyprenyltransferase [Deltaproteobacteria bacterium]